MRSGMHVSLSLIIVSFGNGIGGRAQRRLVVADAREVAIVAVRSPPWTPGVSSRAPTSCSPTRGWPRPSGNSAGPSSRPPSPARRIRRGPGRSPPDRVADAAVAALPPSAATLTPVINATGVLLHTNLGRAPLSGAATDALPAAAGCTDVEFDLASGTRGAGAGGRSRPWRPRCRPPRACTWSTTAAALVLAATALAAGREILISRGEMVEIGDGFRLPDLLQSTGARLREVGTTNRTTVADYQAAAGPATAFALKVHPPNFRIEGFTVRAGVFDLALGPGPGHPGHRRHRLGHAGARIRGCRTSPTRRRHCGTGRRSSPRAATSCSAAPEAACCSAGRPWSGARPAPLARALRVAS